jgi:hypothetical protein
MIAYRSIPVKFTDRIVPDAFLVLKYGVYFIAIALERVRLSVYT